MLSSKFKSPLHSMTLKSTGVDHCEHLNSPRIADVIKHVQITIAQHDTQVYGS